ncbi:MAG: phenylacetate--CoA ligase family protein [Terriglobia bacterium]
MSAPSAMITDRYTRMISGVLFPLHERLKGHASVPVRKALEQSQWWSQQRLASMQLERLKALLYHAAEHVPYYRALFGRLQFNPAEVRNLGDLQKLPLLDKADIRSNVNALKSDRAVGLAKFNTGGSTGEPLIFYAGKNRVTHDVAAKWRATRWWGVDIGDPEIVVWGSPIELGAQDRVRRIRDLILRTHLLPAFDLSEQNVNAFLATIRAKRPRMLFGYPSALAHIARQALAREMRMDALGIRVTFVTSEQLYEDQREIIERVFGCAVANGYGGRDAGFVAHACPDRGMHINAEDIIVETVRADGRHSGTNEPGEIVITHLATSDYPFIRYRTGDIGVLGSKTCSCGRGLPILKEIRGRSTDFVVAADGTVMHGLALIYVIRGLGGITAFKIVQESRALTRVQIVPGPDFDPTARQAIVDGFRARLGRTTEVRIEEVAAIPPERSGKYRYVVSKVTDHTPGHGGQHA